MPTSTLKDRVRAATSAAGDPQKRAAVPPAETVGGGTPDELQVAERAEGGETTDAVLAWLERYGDHFTKALPSHVDSGAFFAAVRAALPGLAPCTPASLLQALLACARFGLVPDGRHAVIRREGSLAVFVPMYQGYVDLMYRSGRVASVHVGLIHAGDEWEYTPTAPAPLDFTHRPALELTREQRGKPILAYAFCWMTGGAARSQVVLLSREDAEEIRDEYSEAYQRALAEGRADSFWHTDFNAMWCKSALRRLHKVVPMSAELVQLGKADDAGDSGRAQVLHAPDEDRQALADAVAAHRAAEGSQEPVRATLPRKRTQPKRAGSRRSRKGRGRRR
ncbi:recombinase RecT [Streptomyces kronopolitis]|uniref:recombinase RecT n=1 Tax=Streptomyces kronopolitis TaxID=1612435 RepID=UPI00341B64B3